VQPAVGCNAWRTIAITLARKAKSMSMDKAAREELKKRREEAVRLALDSFPYERIEVVGEKALATWQDLRASRPDSSPVVIGGDDDFRRIIEGSIPWPGAPTRRTAEQILEAAERLRHPEDLKAKYSSDMARARERMTQLMRDKPSLPIPPFIEDAMSGASGTLNREALIEAMSQDSEATLGDWPSEPMSAPEFTVATEALSGRPLAKAQIVMFPTDDWTAIPAYLNFGNWNGCPAPEYHVAALRSWRDRFGAQLIGLSHDVMNIRVNRRPETREAALELAREQYLYCNDIVDQGVGNLSALAAILMAGDWWYFWWD
jgi:hypothetical protein